MTWQDFLQAAWDIFYPRKKPRASEETRKALAGRIQEQADRTKGTPGYNPTNIASTAWNKYKREQKKGN